MEDTMMLTTKIKYCDKCQEDVEANVIERPATYNFRGETFEIRERVFNCACGEDLYDETLDSETMETLSALYQTRIGLSLEEIKSIRIQYGLSMDLFSRILGWSKSTVVRYESGKYIPDSTHMTILKRLKEHPEIIDEFFKINKHRFNEKEQSKITEKLSNSDQITVEKSLFEALKINYKLQEKTIESGYNAFNIDKLINMILFFAQNGIQKTKLMKMLFYADFLNYKRNLLSISGMPYVRLPYGPVPKDHDLLLSTIDKNEIIGVEYEFYNEYTFINVKAKKKFDNTLFSEEELKILSFIQEYFKGFGSVAISDFSHKEDGWLNTEDRDIISYDYADALSIDLNN